MCFLTSFLILLYCFPGEKPQKQEGKERMPENSVLQRLWNMFAKLTQIKTFLIVTNLIKCLNFVFNHWRQDDF